MDEYACAILLKGGRILMGLRAPHRKTYANCWDVIGGKIENGESADEALLRELREEIGIRPDNPRYLESLSDRNLGVSPAPLYHFYLVRKWAGEPSICNHEHTELNWFSTDELAATKNMRIPEYHAIFERAKAA